MRSSEAAYTKPTDNTRGDIIHVATQGVSHYTLHQRQFTSAQRQLTRLYGESTSAAACRVGDIRNWRRPMHTTRDSTVSDARTLNAVDVPDLVD